MTNRITVYFDGTCPLCQREIAWYQRQRGSNTIRWVDVSVLDNENIDRDLTRQQAMARFHVRLPDGQLVNGAKAFAALLVSLPRVSAFGKLIRLPLIVSLADLMYRMFLRVRPGLQKWAARKSKNCAKCDESAY